MPQTAFKSKEEALFQIDEFIKEYEKMFACSTSMMVQQWNRDVIERTPHVIAWKQLYDVREYLERNPNAIQADSMEIQKQHP